MVEADYRMKLIAVGVEPPPIRMTTFVGALKGAPRDMQAWWLTPEYKCVKQANDGLSVQLIGRGVALKTENILFGQRAQVLRTKLKPSRAARSYASSFTKLYEQISQRRPVFAQLRNAINLLVLTAWIAKSDGYQKSGWQPDLLLDDAQAAPPRSWQTSNMPPRLPTRFGKATCWFCPLAEAFRFRPLKL